MWIVAIAWIYVVGLMAVTETGIVAGGMTFVGYCVIPLSILFYLSGGARRRARRETAKTSASDGAVRGQHGDGNASGAPDGGSDGGGD